MKYVEVTICCASIVLLPAQGLRARDMVVPRAWKTYCIVPAEAYTGKGT